MRRRTAIVLAAFLLLSLAGGWSVLAALDASARAVRRLLALHRSELLRETLLVQAKRVQNDLALHDTPSEPPLADIVDHARDLEGIIASCGGCHHAPPVRRRLRRLKSAADAYKWSLSRVFTLRANQARIAAATDQARRLGEGLVAEARRMRQAGAARIDRETPEVLAAMRRSRRVILALALAGPLVCLCLAALFFRFTAGQLRRLLHAARRIREGDLDHRVPPLRDEFGELAGAFNDMAAALEEQIQKARRAQQLAVCGEMATRLAHEIKNPLAGIRASMEVLAEDPDIPPADRPILERVLAEVERVHRLTRNLLDFARPPAPSPAPFQLPEIVEQALTFACREPGGGEVRVERRYDEDLPEVTADPAQVQQVFLNLFLNAVEAMPAGGTLQVRLRAVDGGARVAAEVSDTGGGVPPGELHRIFEPFFTTKHKGTGLGLTITHNLVTANGGDIQARANPGGGMTFAVILPARRKDPP